MRAMQWNRRIRWRFATVAQAVATSLWVAPAGAQRLDSGFEPGLDRGVRISTGVRYESFDEDRSGLLGERLGQLNVFGVATALLRVGLRMDVMAGWNETNWHQLGEVSSANDTKIDMSWRMSERIMLGGGINVPTGRTKLGLDELRLAQGTASRLKGYSTSKFGEGTDLDARAVYGFSVGGLRLAAGVGCLFKGRYTLVSGLGQYDPGDQITFSLGGDAGAPQALWRANASYTLYARDEIDSRDVFEFGNRLRLEALHDRSGPGWSSLLRARAIVREDSKRYDTTQPVEPEASEDQSAELYADHTLDFSLREPVGLVTLAAARFFGDRDPDLGSGHRIDLGGGVRLGSKRTLFTVRGRSSFGRLTIEDFAVPGGRRRVPFTGWGVDGVLTRVLW